MANKTALSNWKKTKATTIYNQSLIYVHLISILIEFFNKSLILELILTLVNRKNFI